MPVTKKITPFVPIAPARSAQAQSHLAPLAGKAGSFLVKPASCAQALPETKMRAQLFHAEKQVVLKDVDNKKVIDCTQYPADYAIVVHTKKGQENVHLKTNNFTKVVHVADSPMTAAKVHVHTKVGDHHIGQNQLVYSKDDHTSINGNLSFKKVEDYQLGPFSFSTKTTDDKIVCRHWVVSYILASQNKADATRLEAFSSRFAPDKAPNAMSFAQSERYFDDLTLAASQLDYFSSRDFGAYVEWQLRTLAADLQPGFELEENCIVTMNLPNNTAHVVNLVLKVKCDEQNQLQFQMKLYDPNRTYTQVRMVSDDFAQFGKIDFNALNLPGCTVDTVSQIGVVTVPHYWPEQLNVDTNTDTACYAFFVNGNQEGESEFNSLRNIEDHCLVMGYTKA